MGYLQGNITPDKMWIQKKMILQVSVIDPGNDLSFNCNNMSHQILRLRWITYY